jgi:YbbR domain-containing protein
MIPFFQNLILKDFWLKLFSFALASLVWVIVNIAIKKDISPANSLSLAPSDQRVFRDLPIVILSSADAGHSFTINPKVATVTLQGDAAGLRNLRIQDVRVLVDLSDLAVLQDSRKRIEVSTPAGVSHVRVDPEDVLVTSVAKN